MIAGPSSLGYSQSGLSASGQPVGFQVQGPQGPSAAPPGWFPAPATGKTCDILYIYTLNPKTSPSPKDLVVFQDISQCTL